MRVHIPSRINGERGGDIFTGDRPDRGQASVDSASGEFISNSCHGQLYTPKLYRTFWDNKSPLTKALGESVPLLPPPPPQHPPRSPPAAAWAGRGHLGKLVLDAGVLIGQWAGAVWRRSAGLCAGHGM